MVENNTYTPDSSVPRNILVARFSALGDVCMAIPVVYGVCRANPNVRLVFVTKPAVTGLFINPPANLVVVGADVKHEYSGVNGLRKLFSELRQQYHIDAFADLHDVLRTRMIDIFCRLRGVEAARIHKGRADKKLLTRRTDKVLEPLAESTERYIDVFNRLGIEVDTSFRSLYGDGRGNPSEFAHITLPKQPGEKWIGIAPFAAHPGKIYPIHRMKQVVESLVRLPGVKIFLFGGGDVERAVLAEWVNEIPHTLSLAGKRYGFAVELALISWLDVMVSMDSANMHLASLVNTPVVSIWGATHPYCGFSGWHQSPDLAVQLDIPCRPCSVFGNKECYIGDFRCMRAIEPQMIIDKVKKTITHE